MKLRIFNFSEYSIKKYNFKIVLLIAVLSVIGYLILSSAMANDIDRDSTLSKQMLGLIIGTAFMLLLSIVDYHFILKIAPVIYIGVVALLALVLVMGVSAGDSTRWIKIAGIQFQPSEFAKIGLIVVFAAFFGFNKERINKIWVILCALALYGVVAFLIYKEPDLSTTIVTLFIFICMIYIAKISYKWIIGTVAVAVPAIALVILQSVKAVENGTSGILKPYQVNRIMSWLFPDQYAASGLTTQQENSILAISSGQLYGKGLNNTSFESVKNGNFLSEENCDFIFAVIGEELGFIGSIILLLIFTFLVIECFRIAFKAKDMGGRLIASGMGCLIAFQTFVNVAVATGLLPNTGLPLPFISAGVSSLTSIFMGMGVVLNVGLQRKNSEVDW